MSISLVEEKHSSLFHPSFSNEEIRLPEGKHTVTVIVDDVK